MDTHSLTTPAAGGLLSLIVALLIIGLYVLVLRMFGVRDFFRPRNVTPEARQRLYLSSAFVMLLAGALWMVAPATAQFESTGGIAFLSGGVTLLILGLRSKPGPRNVTPEARQRLYLSSAFVMLLAGALWMVALATAQFESIGGSGFLGGGVVLLIFGLRSKPGQKP